MNFANGSMSLSSLTASELSSVELVKAARLEKTAEIESTMNAFHIGNMKNCRQSSRSQNTKIGVISSCCFAEKWLRNVQTFNDDSNNDDNEDNNNDYNNSEDNDDDDDNNDDDVDGEEDSHKRNRGTQRIVSVEYLFGRPVLASNFRLGKCHLELS